MLTNPFYYIAVAKCEDLTPPINGQFTKLEVSFDLHEEVAFTCTDGYKFEDGAETTLLCEDDGLWNGTVPTCISKFAIVYENVYTNSLVTLVWYLMVDPTEKDTKHIKDQSMCTEVKGKRGKQKEKGKVNQFNVGGPTQ